LSGDSVGVFAAATTTAVDTPHCDQLGFPSCYSVGYHDGYKSGITICPTGHSLNYCAGWRAGAGNTTHCDRPGWPSCYDLGYQAGKKAISSSGAACPSGHSKNYCAGYEAGNRSSNRSNET
jgi:hypothetical protein